MASISRRDFMRQGSLGLAAAGAGTLILSATARATESSGSVGSYTDYHAARATPAAAVVGAWAPTEDNILGPFHRPGAPFRAKITPPMEPGKTLVVGGRVWGQDTRKPLAWVMLDIWQANDKGRYDNDDPDHPPAAGVFHNRARIMTDESGYYEFETVRPGRYKTDPNTWRPSHIHYWVRRQGYRELVTQLYFKGDPYNETDQYIKKSLIREMAPMQNGAANYEIGRFDIVLAAI